MNKNCIILILAAAFLVPVNAEAQLGSKLKKKFEEAVSKSIEPEVTEDSTVNESETAQEERQFDLSKLGVGKVTANYDENYHFKGMMKMKTELYDKGKPGSIMDFNIWFDAANGNMGMESETITDDAGESISSTAIVDSKNKVVITWAVMEGGKSGMIMTVPDSLMDDREKVTVTGSAATIRKTGGTKTICGYKCDEYEVTEEEGKFVSKVWASDDLKFPGSRKMLGRQQGMPRGYGQGEIKGAIMASETYEKGKLTTKSEVTKVDLTATNSISVAGVKLMQMDMGRWGQKNR